MVSIEFEGKVCFIGASRSFNKKNGDVVISQEYAVDVFEEDCKYPSKLAFEVVGADKIQQFDIKEGDDIKVKANIQSTVWQGRCFTSMRAWSVFVEKKGTEAPPQPNTHVAEKTEKKQEEKTRVSHVDDLPF